MSRKKAVLMMAGLVYLAAIPCALSFNVLSDYTFNLQDKAFTFFDIADYLASNLLLPFGGFSAVFLPFLIFSLAFKSKKLIIYAQKYLPLIMFIFIATKEFWFAFIGLSYFLFFNMYYYFSSKRKYDFLRFDQA